MTDTSKHSFVGYIERLEMIRRLSSPSLEGIVDADVYSEQLKDNFTRIGKLAYENRAFLETALFPLLYSATGLSAEQTEALRALGENLLSATEAENLDLPIMSLISNRLLQDAAEHDDVASTIRHLDLRMDTCYALMIMIGRIRAYPELAEHFRSEGLDIGRRILACLEKDAFSALDAQSRSTVLTDARYMAVFYEGSHGDERLRSPELEHLDAMLELSEDPFYRALMPDYDWRYFRYRALNYYAKSTDLCNERGFGPGLLEKICQRTEDFAALWHSDPQTFSRFDNERQLNLLLTRNRWLAGRLTREEYFNTIVALYSSRDPWQYDLNGIYDNLQIPLEIICMLDPEHLTEQDVSSLIRFYRHMIRYAFNMPNSGSLSTMLEYYIGIMDRFIEVPGGPSFEEMSLQCLAALHPPTYVHSIMVADIAACLCDHMIDAFPERLIGALGCETAEEVTRRRDEILDYTLHAARCHDFGKLSIIDTIFVYGRNLFDMEFELIRTHPRTGWQMLRRYPATRPYADIALGHHRWYDNSRGYPADFNTAESPAKPIIDLVLCADCLDAATDSVGRSYRQGKTLDDFIHEIGPECGTHYPPWIVDLLRDEATGAAIRQILEEGRKETYRSTYRLLRRMSEFTE